MAKNACPNNGSSWPGINLDDVPYEESGIFTKILTEKDVEIKVAGSCSPATPFPSREHTDPAAYALARSRFLRSYPLGKNPKKKKSWFQKIMKLSKWRMTTALS